MEIKLIASIFHEMVRAAEARNGGKKIRNEEQFSEIFEDAKQQAVANLEDVTFDNILGID